MTINPICGCSRSGAGIWGSAAEAPRRFSRTAGNEGGGGVQPVRVYLPCVRDAVSTAVASSPRQVSHCTLHSVTKPRGGARHAAGLHGPLRPPRRTGRCAALFPCDTDDAFGQGSPRPAGRNLVSGDPLHQGAAVISAGPRAGQSQTSRGSPARATYSDRGVGLLPGLRPRSRSLGLARVPKLRSRECALPSVTLCPFHLASPSTRVLTGSPPRVRLLGLMVCRFVLRSLLRCHQGPCQPHRHPLALS